MHTIACKFRHPALPFAPIGAIAAGQIGAGWACDLPGKARLAAPLKAEFG
jgi:hypothetical protein